MDEEKLVSVYYTFYEHMEDHKWKYGRFPDGWWYSGGGIILSAHQRYDHQEQFKGPIMLRTAMWYFLDRAFKELHHRSIIKYYFIRNERI